MFDVIVVLDQDYERSPGVTTTEGPVRQTTIVWPAHSIESLMLAPPVLTAWLRAHFGAAAPGDLESLILDALAAADADVELLRSAIADLSTARIGSLVRGGLAPIHGAGRDATRDAVNEAQELVRAQPSVWQRGKDRAAFVLRKLRERLPAAVRGHMPTDLARLIAHTDTNAIGLALDAVPGAVASLFERMSQASDSVT